MTMIQESSYRRGGNGLDGGALIVFYISCVNKQLKGADLQEVRVMQCSQWQQLSSSTCSSFLTWCS